MKRTSRRRGLSLLEVILAIAILGGSLVVIGQLVRAGTISALQTRLRSEANLLCDTKMAELSAGVIDLQSVGATEIEENPNWYYTVDVQQGTQLGLLVATVTVEQVAIEDSISVSITRFMPDPDYDPAEDVGDGQ